MTVTQICEDFIKGTAGSVDILIPSTKMTDELQFVKEESIYAVKMDQRRI